MIALRKIYGEVLVSLGKEYKDIVVLDADLAKSTMTYMFQKEFPDRFFDIGIAEQDMFATAAGLSTTGLIPFASTFAIFAAGRAWEQIRNSIAYNNLNVKIVATHAGITVGEDGGSHQAIEDIALMRVLPNMKVLSPADRFEAEWVIREIVKHKGPFYVRLGRNPVPDIYTKPKDFKLGKAELIREGKEIAILATGFMVSIAIKVGEMLKENDGIESYIYSFHTIKPIDKKTINEVAKKVKMIFTLEEHNIYGGFGSAVKEVLEEPIPIDIIGIEDRFGQSGSVKELLEEYGLSENKIYNRIIKKIKEVI